MNEVVNFIEKVEEYATKLIKVMEEGTHTLQQLCDSVADNVAIIDELKVILPPAIYFAYDEFFGEFKTICELCKNPDFLDSNAELILGSFDLYVECLDIINTEYTKNVRECSCCGKNAYFQDDRCFECGSSDSDKIEVSNEMLENGPLVSVIMSCYNHEQYVAETIESVINQTYKNIEFLVADDASTDNSVEVMKRYSKHYAGEYYYETNYGSRIWDLFEKTTGKYVAMINSDDVWETDKIAMQVQYLENHEDVLACFTYCDYADENMNIIPSTTFYVKNKNRYEWMENFWRIGNSLCYPSILIRREIYEKLKHRQKACRQLADFFHWVDLVQMGEIYVIPRSLIKMRRYINSKVSNMSSISVENMTRDFMESMTHWMYEIEEMDNRFFSNTFRKYFIKEDANTDEEIKCEKFFLMYNNPRRWIQNNAFYYYMKIYMDEKVRKCFEYEYNFNYKTIFKAIVEKGFGTYVREDVRRMFEN